MLDKVVRNADVADVDNLSFSSSLRIFSSVKLSLWVTFLAETSNVLEIILITTVLSFTNSLSRTSLYFSLKTSFVYSNLFSLAKASAWKTIRKTQYSCYEN